MYNYRYNNNYLPTILSIVLFSSIQFARFDDIINTDNAPVIFDDLLLISTIDGYLRAIEPHSGVVKWSLKEDPVLVSPKIIQRGFTFLPDPQDGGLYVLKDGQLKKLPYSIPQLVTASPCRTTDGVLYAGSKRDVWLEIDPNTGLKLDEVSQSQSERQCPLSKNSTVFIGRSEYKLTMVDPENRDRRWNASFTDYSSHLLPADPTYPYQHFTSTMDGRLITVNEAKGIVSWKLDVGSTVVAMYILQKDGLHKLPYAVIGKETLEEFAKDPWQNVVRAWIDDVSQARSTLEATAATRHLFPTLYVGESSYGLFAMPAFVDGRTVTIAPKYLGPPLLEGPTPIAMKNENSQQRSSASTRPIALIDLNVAKITHKTVDGEFLVLGYHEPPQVAASQLVPRRPFRQLYPSLPFINTDRQLEEDASSIHAIAAKHQTWSVYELWANNRLTVIIIGTSSVTLIFVVSCWILYKMQQSRRKQEQLLEEQQQQQLEAKYAQTTKSLGNFWHAHRVQQQLPDGWLLAGNIAYNPDDRLGHGCEGTVVFRGKFDGREVAVKRVIADIRLADREADLLRESDAHPNVIRYFCMESDSNFRYIALELCDYSLFDYVESEEIRSHCSLSGMDILHQATKGLAYLHSINIVHRDMKPQNVLLSRRNSANTKNGAVRALISDFGLCKRLQAGRNSLSRRSGLTGTDGWIAPEALASDASVTCAVDVFSLGCIYYYVLTIGKHPFGDVLKRQANIMQGEYSLKWLSTTGNFVGVALIESMLRRNPDLRPTSATLSVHPFFWTKERQLQFFMDVSDRIEKLDEQDLLVRRLEENAHRAVGYNWRQTICPALAEDLRKFRTYRGNTVRDLLRAMRNKKHHYRELPPEVRQSLGHIPDQFVTYFTDRFPQLLQHTYQAMICCANEHAFVGYYAEEAQKMAEQFETENNETDEVEIAVDKMITDHLLTAETVVGSSEIVADEKPENESNGRGEWIEVGSPKIKRQDGKDATGIRKRKKRIRNKAANDGQPHHPPPPPPPH